ncbi:cupredoxin domain-containing protein [Lignipirellula cremea]|uniref:Rhamnogalacturonan lyase domain-containing protein n=1 Tax=Lignipirellula cremea TaxID=2528010 RepID=A0A518DYS6_9BACT|nr:hypothetical protein [Lignipirellula cremea]QDU97007.1 hypothetical protein Pla8534_48320 [Lignipirellula cremea]
MRLTLTVLALAGGLLLPAASADAQWGNLKGKFVVQGAVPAPAAVDVNKDVAVCAKTPLVNEDLVVSSDGELANVVIWLYPGAGAEPPKSHISYRISTRKPVVFDNLNCRFEPHIVVAHTGQPVELKNSDPVQHNTKINFFANNPINPLLPASSKTTQKFDQPERLPAGASCSIHPWMVGWVFVLDHPYATVSAKNGEFEIKNLPVGTWNFRVWQERCGYVREVIIDGKETEWSKGVVQIKIDAGDNDLGTIAVPATLFAN